MYQPKWGELGPNLNSVYQNNATKPPYCLPTPMSGVESPHGTKIKSQSPAFNCAPNSYTPTILANAMSTDTISSRRDGGSKRSRLKAFLLVPFLNYIAVIIFAHIFWLRDFCNWIHDSILKFLSGILGLIYSVGVRADPQWTRRYGLYAQLQTSFWTGTDIREQEISSKVASGLNEESKYHANDYRRALYNNLYHQSGNLPGNQPAANYPLASQRAGPTTVLWNEAFNLSAWDSWPAPFVLDRTVNWSSTSRVSQYLCECETSSSLAAPILDLSRNCATPFNLNSNSVAPNTANANILPDIEANEPTGFQDAFQKDALALLENSGFEHPAPVLGNDAKSANMSQILNAFDEAPSLPSFMPLSPVSQDLKVSSNHNRSSARKLPTFNSDVHTRRLLQRKLFNKWKRIKARKMSSQPMSEALDENDDQEEKENEENGNKENGNEGKDAVITTEIDNSKLTSEGTSPEPRDDEVSNSKEAQPKKKEGKRQRFRRVFKSD